MKSFVLISIALAFSMNAKAQQSPVLTWSNGFPCNATVVGSPDGGLYLAGVTTATGLSTDMTGPTGLGSFLVMKLDGNEDLDWGTYFGTLPGTNPTGYVSAMALDGDLLYVAGVTASTSGIATAGTQEDTFTPLQSNDAVAFIRCFDASSGALIWGSYYAYDPDAQLYINGLAGDGAGNVYFSSLVDPSQMVLDSPGNSPNDGTELALVKFDGSGVQVWAEYYGTDGNETSAGLAYDTGNDIVYAAGSTDGTGLPGVTNSPYGDKDAFIAAFSTSGAVQTAVYFGSSALDVCFGMALQGDDVAITGYTHGTSLPSAASCVPNTNNGEDDMFTAKFNRSDLANEWTAVVGSAGYEYGLFVDMDGAGDVYVSWITYYGDDLATAGAYDETFEAAGVGFETTLLSKFASDGQLVYSTYLDGTEDPFQDPISLNVTDDGRIYASAYIYYSSLLTMNGPFTSFDSELARVMRFDPDEGCEPGAECDTDSEPGNEVWNDECECVSAYCLHLNIQTDDDPEETSWSIVGSGITWSGGGASYCGHAQETITETILVPEATACYSLEVFDSGNNGMLAGDDGGYVLETCDGKRIIDNDHDGNFAGTSSVNCGASDFCLPLGTVVMQSAYCDMDDYLLNKVDNQCNCPADDIIGAELTTAVTNAYQNSAYGYRYQIFDPDGGHLFQTWDPNTSTAAHCNVVDDDVYCGAIQHTQVSNGWCNAASGTNSQRYHWVNPNSWTTRIPPVDVWLNIHVQVKLNGVFEPYGPVCRIKFVGASCNRRPEEGGSVGEGLVLEVPRLSVVQASGAAGLQVNVNNVDNPGNEARIELVDALGRYIDGWSYWTGGLSQWSAEVPTPALRAGMYVISVRTSVETLTRRFVVE